MKTVNVLMSTFNGEKYIEKQVDSIMSQIGINIVLTIRDDDSTDSTIKILETLKNKYSNLKWYKGENIGPALSFYHLLLEAEEADYYAFADQDDFWEPDKLKRAIQMIEDTTSPCIYYSNATIVDENLTNTGMKVYSNNQNMSSIKSIFACNILGCTMVWNNKFQRILQKNTSQPKYIHMHDSYLSMICTAIGGDIFYDNYAGLKYRQHDKNVIGINNRKKVVAKIKYAINYLLTDRNPRIGDQANELLLYPLEFSEEGKQLLIMAANTRTSLKVRLRVFYLILKDYIQNNRSKIQILNSIKMLIGKL